MGMGLVLGWNMFSISSLLGGFESNANLLVLFLVMKSIYQSNIQSHILKKPFRFEVINYQ